MKQKKNLWVNLLFAAVVLVIAGVLFYLRSAGQSGSTLGAELIYGDANTVQKISLDKDAVYLRVGVEPRDKLKKLTLRHALGQVEAAAVDAALDTVALLIAHIYL